jgi:hypothetical protein
MTKFFLLLMTGVPFLGKANALALKQNLMDTTNAAVYKVKKVDAPLTINGDWNKDQWKNIETIPVKRHMGKMPRFVPTVEAKMAYDDNNVYIIFRVQDRHVQSTVTEINGPVSENSCVEFFFSPDSALPLHYFNLEINAGGTPLMFYITKPWTGVTRLKEEEIKAIEIAHSLPPVVNPEMEGPVTWTIEYRIPLSMIKKYSNVSQPAPGVQWKGNFYKTGSKTSNPNYMTWSFVDNEKPNFHLPQFFGTLIFE